MRMQTCALVLAVALAVPLFGQAGGPVVPATPAAAVPVKPKPIVQIAILLDTSNSMDGLIEQAKSQLWKIVNEFAKARRDGVAPDIQVALYQYGTPSLGVETGYIRQVVPLTDDLDKISAELFKLTTNGGDEYCGMVIQKAAAELKWSDDKNAFKAIYIAGNEPFTQGGVDYHVSCKEAITKGIIVNTIFCGTQAEGASTGWKDGATLADGAYAAIDQNTQIVAIQAPQDKEIAELGTKINTTYLGYGAGGGFGAANQAAQDANAAGAGGGRGGAAVERSIAKSSSAYQNGGWDLVDAVNTKKVDLSTVKDEDLPADMQKLDAKGRADYIAQKTKEREEIKTKIQQLSTDRDKYIAEQRQKTPETTLDAAVLGTVRTQATKNGMTFTDAPK
jgi:hypothetical protein